EGRERLLERPLRRAVGRHERIALALGAERPVVGRPGDRDLARAERVELVGLRDARHAQAQLVALYRRDLEAVAHPEVVLLRELVGDDRAAGAELRVRGVGALLPVEAEDGSDPLLV